MPGAQIADNDDARAEWRRRWPLVVTSTIGLSLPGVSIVTIGAFIVPLEQAFGWTRSEVTSGLIIYSLVGMLGQPIVGRLVDMWGPRLIALIGVILSGITFSLFAMTDGSLSWWLLNWLLYSLAVQLVHLPVWSSAVASEFQAGRGLALAISSTGASFGSMLAPICATVLIGTHGWSIAYLVIGVVQAGVALVLSWFFFYSRSERLKSRPEKAGVAPVPASAKIEGLDFRQSILSPQFIKLFIGTLITYLVGTAVVIHLIPIMMDGGLNADEAAIVAGSIGVFSIVVTIGVGFLTARFQGHYLYAILALLPVVSFVMLLIPGDSVALRILAVACLGASGARLNIIMYMLTRHFGMRAYGVLLGVLLIPVKLSNGAGASLASYLYDVTQSYDLLLYVCSIGAAVAALILLGIGRYPPSPEEARS